jgi:hypothetical protein
MIVETVSRLKEAASASTADLKEWGCHTNAKWTHWSDNIFLFIVCRQYTGFETSTGITSRLQNETCSYCCTKDAVKQESRNTTRISQHSKLESEWNQGMGNERYPSLFTLLSTRLPRKQNMCTMLGRMWHRQIAQHGLYMAPRLEMYRCINRMTRVLIMMSLCMYLNWINLFNAGLIKPNPKSSWFTQLLTAQQEEYKEKGWVLS